MWRADVLTLYPDMFPGPLGHSLHGRALGSQWSMKTTQIRDFSIGKHKTVDDTPAGGGVGMVLRADVVAAALDSLPHDNRPRLVMSPSGYPLTQAQVKEWAAGDGLVILCGRFEGVDERVIEKRNLIPVSIGDYVLSGGEVAAMVVLEACVRLLPGVMGKLESAESESFEGSLLEYPHFTRPQEFEGLKIPDVLLNGDHAKIAAFRQSEALRLTKARRPDLLAQKSK